MRRSFRLCGSASRPGVAECGDERPRHHDLAISSEAGRTADLSGKFLVYLDLSELNFKGANLAHSDFYGTDFTGANLKGADLSHTRLDRSVLMRADLSGANLTGATILRPTIYADLSNNTLDAPRFAGANLTGVHVQAELSGSDFRGADLSNANFYPLEGRPGEGTLATAYRNILKYTDFSGARLHDTNMERAVLWFAKFTGADLKGANFTDADLSRADFAGADISGADFTRADLDGANFVGAIADRRGQRSRSGGQSGPGSAVGADMSWLAPAGHRAIFQKIANNR